MKRFLQGSFPGLMVLALDQWVKHVTEGRTDVLLPGVLGIRSTKNTGMALGLFQGGTVGILAVTVLLIGVCVLLLRGVRLGVLARIALSMMAGGALGNMVDRLALGYVRDMLELLFMHFYIFNVADVGVVCGAVLCGVSLLLRPQDWSKGE